uniref:Fam-a protein n=1 Tax=Strongyloides papillosus TaxID=174720 RepID=A0A0N5BGN3_STREA
MSSCNLIYVDFLKSIIENTENDVSEINNHPLIIKVSTNMNNGFEATDNYSKLLKTKIKEISAEFLEHIIKYGRVVVAVKKMHVSTRFDFILHEFHKELEVSEYEIVNTPKIFPNDNINLINTKMDLDIKGSFEKDSAETDLKEIYNTSSNISTYTIVLILSKSNLNKKKHQTVTLLMFFLTDYEGNIMNCICYNTSSSDVIYNTFKTRNYYLLKLLNASHYKNSKY